MKSFHHPRIYFGAISVLGLCAALLLGASGSFAGVEGRIVSFTIDRFIGSVGISSSVAPNEWNTLAQSLEEREADIAERENTLLLREQELLEERARLTQGSTTLWALVGAVCLLAALLGLNFYLDRRRGGSDAHKSGPHEGELVTKL